MNTSAITSWPLNVSNITLLDRIKLASFFIQPKNKWTQDRHVTEFEKIMANYIGCKYAVFVSSGSTANTLISQYVKDLLKDTPNKNIVVLPSTTWQTSCSPWIREGFKPHFIDISLDDFSINKLKLEEYVKQNADNIACIFPTSLIGFTPDIDFYLKLQAKYGVRVYFDNCENTLGKYNLKNVSAYFTSSTSTYFGHQVQSVEGGFIFTNSYEEYEYFLMNRNHGMTRSLKMYGLPNDKYKNNQVDELFDFYSLGNNFRNTDIHAFIGKLDFKRHDTYTSKRIELYNLYKNSLDRDKFYLCDSRPLCTDVPFCLPVISKKSQKLQIIQLCKDLSIEYRPIISGFLGYQTCYRKYFNEVSNYPNSINLHENGIYVGLYSRVSPKSILKFTEKLNQL